MRKNQIAKRRSEKIKKRKIKKKKKREKTERSECERERETYDTYLGPGRVCHVRSGACCSPGRTENVYLLGTGTFQL